MWIYPFMFFINVMLQATMGFKTNNWGSPIFTIVALGILLFMMMLCEINKTIKENKQVK